MSSYLNGKKAIVTGANRSIGKAIALAFAKEGADVAISYRSDEKGAKETIEAVEAVGCQGKFIRADFRNSNEIERFFEEALGFLGHVDILVNNAAGYNTSPLLDLEMATFEEQIKIGVTTPLKLTQLAAR